MLEAARGVVQELGKSCTFYSEIRTQGGGGCKKAGDAEQRANKEKVRIFAHIKRRLSRTGKQGQPLKARHTTAQRVRHKAIIAGRRTRCKRPQAAAKGKYLMMNREQLKQEIRRRVPMTDYLTKSKGKQYVCPYPDCGSGTGQHGTGALTIYPDTNTWHCFACGRHGDVIDLYQQATGTDFNTALQQLAAQLNLETGTTAPANAPKNDFEAQGKASARKNDKTPQKAPQPPQDANADYTEYFAQCVGRLNDPAASAYLVGARGISLDTAAAHWIGFDPQADPANAPGGIGAALHPCPRIIIPSSTAHYMGRSIDPATDKAFAKMNVKGSKPGIFNIDKTLYAPDVQEVFVTEGAFDALSILEAGAAAIALNSTANADALIKQLEQHRPAESCTMILCLDNDDAGRKATQVLRAGLQRLNISFTTADICGQYKDPNERLQHDREGFCAAIEQAQRQTAARPDNVKDYISKYMAGEIEAFRSEIKTGYENLDDETGGLYSGLYCIAAISSLGKTTFAAQMADQIAAAGHDVLFFSLEQSRLEMVSKSIARITAQKNLENAVTSLSIRKGYLPRQVQEAATEYTQQVQERMSIIEGNFNCTISFIGDYVRQYIRRTGTRPVVFIDYLQILQGEPQERGGRQSTKEVVDSTVTELKRISRENGLTVFIISSVNRANYLTPIDFEALKESGGIEYTCDCVWGLQLQCLNDPIFDRQNNIKERRAKIKEAKAANPRKIELCCLKNRYGIANFSVFFDYYPANDLFVPCYDDDSESPFESKEKHIYKRPARVKR